MCISRFYSLVELTVTEPNQSRTQIKLLFMLTGSEAGPGSPPDAVLCYTSGYCGLTGERLLSSPSRPIPKPTLMYTDGCCNLIQPSPLPASAYARQRVLQPSLVQLAPSPTS